MTNVTSKHIRVHHVHIIHIVVYMIYHRRRCRPADLTTEKNATNGRRWGTRARLGAAAELVAPLGCVTGSARYLFLIRPDGDDGNGDVGQVKCDAIGSDNNIIHRMYIVSAKRVLLFFNGHHIVRIRW